jgi:hypothetical protein
MLAKWGFHQAIHAIVEIATHLGNDFWRIQTCFFNSDFTVKSIARLQRILQDRKPSCTSSSSRFKLEVAFDRFRGTVISRTWKWSSVLPISRFLIPVRLKLACYSIFSRPKLLSHFQLIYQQPPPVAIRAAPLFTAYCFLPPTVFLFISRLINSNSTTFDLQYLSSQLLE